MVTRCSSAGWTTSRGGGSLRPRWRARARPTTAIVKRASTPSTCMATELSDTRRRAELRGREAEAQWRIKSAVWAGRLYAVIFVVLSLVPLLNRGGPSWASTIVFLIIAAGLLFATEQMRKGSRVAAILVDRKASCRERGKTSLDAATLTR